MVYIYTTQIMNEQVLEELGLSQNEARIYLALLNFTEAGVGEIAGYTKIHRRNIYDTLDRLVHKGLVFSIMSRGEHRYAPVDPDKLMELVREKEVTLEKILPDLRNRFEKRGGQQEAYIYRGIEGFKNYMREIVRVGENGYFIGAKLGWFDKRLKGYLPSFEKEAKRKGLHFYHIFDHEVKDILKKKEYNFDKKMYPYKFFPKKYGTHSAIDIFGDYVVTFSGLSLERLEYLQDDVTLFVLRDKNLAESYRTWFQFMWDMCKES
ncbi:MAG: hypothetical protein COV59_00755 [Candidatus Magasanikbacteria bacterium CG11_big_fil_rev_8_21_14_0_20_39_34]|uniref:Transcription regulator TrmB N-terminal domain-containing protein n=1 Tax=Candidatus Magasanikbacteria bacterium CG11_big_fil_rev_8_21_14_0_20_39_34 TaxID=1974653 RepID=A0A2H0N6H3_9BACT|nr:MAG: hypothetical protein COV59_00755 [Candidatus Magasanikbacteria bacterium CG11_big_fil_rev_8_21_14_0_20_39_34]